MYCVLQFALQPPIHRHSHSIHRRQRRQIHPKLPRLLHRIPQNHIYLQRAPFLGVSMHTTKDPRDRVNLPHQLIHQLVPDRDLASSRHINHLPHQPPRHALRFGRRVKPRLRIHVR